MISQLRTQSFIFEIISEQRFLYSQESPASLLILSPLRARRGSLQTSISKATVPFRARKRNTSRSKATSNCPMTLSISETISRGGFEEVVETEKWKRTVLGSGRYSLEAGFGATGNPKDFFSLSLMEMRLVGELNLSDLGWREPEWEGEAEEETEAEEEEEEAWRVPLEPAEAASSLGGREAAGDGTATWIDWGLCCVDRERALCLRSFLFFGIGVLLGESPARATWPFCSEGTMGEGGGEVFDGEFEPESVRLLPADFLEAISFLIRFTSTWGLTVCLLVLFAFSFSLSASSAESGLELRGSAEDRGRETISDGAEACTGVVGGFSWVGVEVEVEIEVEGEGEEELEVEIEMGGGAGVVLGSGEEEGGEAGEEDCSGFFCWEEEETRRWLCGSWEKQSTGARGVI